MERSFNYIMPKLSEFYNKNINQFSILIDLKDITFSTFTSAKIALTKTLNIFRDHYCEYL